MKKLQLTVFIIMVSMIITSATSWSQPGILFCAEVNGLNWCYNPLRCGQPCNDVCATDGMQPVADDQTWFEAQNTLEECVAISQAFGLGNTVDFGDFDFACLEDTSLVSEPSGGTLNAPLVCSSDPNCPNLHRNFMDQQGLECDEIGSHRSICPCEEADPSLPLTSPVPALSQ